MQSEIWKEVPGFPGYQVSNAGRVKCLEMAYYCGNKYCISVTGASATGNRYKAIGYFGVLFKAWENSRL